MTHWPPLVPAVAIGLLAVFGGLHGAEATTRVEIQRADCRLLARHQPRDDATYQPGIDVRGQPVTPADIEDEVGDVGDGSALTLPQTYSIDIELDLRQRFALAPDSPLLRGDANIGVIELRGREVYFNGQRLDGGEGAALAVLCRERLAP